MTSQLVRSEEVAGDYLMRQRLLFRAGGRARTLDAVLQVCGGEVVVVALTPLGTRLFSIRQRGLEIEVEPEQHGWPFPLERILLDAHRAFLYPVAEPPLPDGDQVVRMDDLEIEERWQGGRLMQRIIPRGRGGREDAVVITYDGGMAAGAPPPSVALEDRRRGYALEVETLSKQGLECPDDRR